MSRRLDDLDPRLRPLAFAHLARCVEQGLMVMIVDTLRTEAEQRDNLRRKVSWTRHSKHLPQPPAGLSLAYDLAPYETYRLHGADKLQWDGADPAWLTIGQLGEALGLRWGGRWQTPDLGHFELVVAPDGHRV
jgi:peptidoglycan L-alanyl-D-glutamate endopeptidase CwlK